MSPMTGFRRGMLAVALVSGGAASAQGLHLYVAADGDDANAGSVERPFRTLAGARDAIRAMKAAGRGHAGGVTVELASGVYPMDRALALGEGDSGEDAGPVVYRAAPAAEVVLSGSRQVTGFTPVADAALLKRLPPEARGKVLVADLGAQGIREYGMPAGGFGYNGPPPKFAELFFNGRPMQIARWPNEGFIKVGDLVGGKPFDVRGTQGDKMGMFTCPYEHLERWVGEADLWVHGWWFWDWADQRQQVDSIDLKTRVITLADPQHGYGYRKGMWYYVFNALSELDRPGEYCLDRGRGLLYVWPPDPITDGKASMLQTETLITASDLRHVRFEGLIFEGCRGTAVTVKGGQDVVLQGCTLRNLGGWAVTISDTHDGGVVGCDIYETGQGGVSLSGGDRATLTSIGLHALNNHIHHYSRWNRILMPGLSIHGVGVHVAHNLIHDAPHMAIMFSGNDHVFEYNEIHSVCYESNDAGAIYAGRDWTMRGHEIRHNYLHHISGFEGRGCVGVYLDDMFCGVHIHGNIFYDVTRAAFIGGGRDNIVERNLFVDCRPALHLDARALGWAAGSVEPGAVMQERLQAVPYQNDLWRQRYPELADVWEDEPAKPKGNIVACNVCWGGQWDEVEAVARTTNTLVDNVVQTGRESLDTTFQLRADNPAFKLGFEPLPMEQMGLVNDGTRASWPIVSTVRPRGRPGEKTDGVEAAVAAKPVLPVARVARATVTPTIDGRIDPTEWLGADPSRALIIAEGLENEALEPRSTAWIMASATDLYIAVDNAVDPDRPLKRDAVWGANDAVELSFRGPAAGNGSAPILVLRGYPCGTFQSSTEAGATEAQAAQAGTGVQFAVGEPTGGRWVTEWRIPWVSIGVDPARERRLEFSLAVRKTAQSMWLLWHGTRHATWHVGASGWLELPE